MDKTIFWIACVLSAILRTTECGVTVIRERSSVNRWRGREPTAAAYDGLKSDPSSIEPKSVRDLLLLRSRQRMIMGAVHYYYYCYFCISVVLEETLKR